MTAAAPRPADARPDDTPPVAVTGLSHVFGSGEAAREVLHGVDLSLAPGSLTVLLGASGSGKTTLLTLIGCLRAVQRGSVRLLGQELAGADGPALARARRRLGFIFQAHNLHGSLTAIQNVRLGLAVQGPAAEAAWREAATRVLGLVGLGEKLDHLPSALSGGQRQRVAIARTLLVNPPVLILDDATSAIDVHLEHQIHGALRTLMEGRSTLVISHRLSTISLAQRVAFMEGGRIVAEGTHAELLEAVPAYGEVLARGAERPAGPPARTAPAAVAVD
jgi:putative ABC transport system ATP-binding protein